MDQQQAQAQQAQAVPTQEQQLATLWQQIQQYSAYLTQDELVLIQKLLSWHPWLQQQIAALRDWQKQRDAALSYAYQAVAGQQVAIPGTEYASTSNKGLTFLLMGDIGSWKTTWLGGWPGIYIISIAAEGGDDALVSYPKVAMKMLEAAQQKTPPPVFNVLRPRSKQVRNKREFDQIVDFICTHHKQLGIYTVAVDSVSHLIDMFISEHTAERRKPESSFSASLKSDKKPLDLMRPPDWGVLNNWLRDSRVKLQNQGLNIGYTCLEKRYYDTDDQNMMKRTLASITPMISGGTNVMLPSSCKLIIHAEKEFVPAPPPALGRQMAQPVYWVLPEPHVAGIRHKYYDLFPDGCLIDPDFKKIPTFRAIWNALHDFIYIG